LGLKSRPVAGSVVVVKVDANVATVAVSACDEEWIVRLTVQRDGVIGVVNVSVEEQTAQKSDKTASSPACELVASGSSNEASRLYVNNARSFH